MQTRSTEIQATKVAREARSQVQATDTQSNQHTQPPQPTQPPPREAFTDTQAIPLTDMGIATYLGFEGGLYPGGSNEMPEEHAREGKLRSQSVQPLNRDGLPDPDGKYVFLSIGMSNTTMEFCTPLGTHSETDGITCRSYSFMSKASADQDIEHENMVLLNGARGGQVADRWDAPDEENYTRIRDELLAPLGLSELQVQTAWLKVTNDATGKPILPSGQADAYDLMATMGDIVRALKSRYPNLQQVYISSRIYAGYANREINPEPYAYETGYAVKWLIEAQIRQMAGGGREIDPRAGDLNYETVAPWLAWGPYLWADGSNPRSDGLTWLPEDFGNDGTHPSVVGRGKVADLLLDYFKSSPYSHCWFIEAAGGDACERPIVQEILPTQPATPIQQPTALIDNIQAIPLVDMGNLTYLGFEGGLYSGGSNEMPPEHAAAGLERALRIQPLNQAGEPDPSGKIVFLSVGMSNTMMEFCGPYTDNITCQPYSFMAKADADPLINHNNLVILNGARGAQVAERWDAAQDENYDRVRERLLVPLGLDERQVQVVWLKVVDFLRTRPPLPSEQSVAYGLTKSMGDIVRSLKARYPNLQQVFISSRTYAGYATRELSPEPHAYESGFAVKWLIESQIEQMENGGNAIDALAGDMNYNTVAPWIAWGPYLWANGTQPRSDGLVWLPEDFEADGTHPSDIGREKVASMLLEFFKTSPFTRCWFLNDGDCG